MKTKKAQVKTDTAAFIDSVALLVPVVMQNGVGLLRLQSGEHSVSFSAPPAQKPAATEIPAPQPFTTRAAQTLGDIQRYAQKPAAAPVTIDDTLAPEEYTNGELAKEHARALLYHSS